MKLFPAFAFITFAFAGTCFAQQKCERLSLLSSPTSKFERKRDVLIERSDDPSVSILARKALIERKVLSNCEILEFNFSYIKWKEESPKIDFYFEAISNKFLYDKKAQRRLSVSADGKNVLSTTLNQEHRDELSGEIKREHLSLKKGIDAAFVQILAEAKNVTIRLGERAFVLTDEQHATVRDFYEATRNVR